MATTRTRRAHGLNLPSHIVLTLGLGAGLNHCSDEWLREQWRIYGEALTDYYKRKFNKEPIVARIAREERW